MVLAIQHPQVVAQYIQNEIAANHLRLIGSADCAEQLGIHISPLGVIPKKGRINQWHLIMDFSSPHGHNTNDGIGLELSSLHYFSVDEAALQLAQVSRGALLVKMDIQEAYRDIPVS